MNVSLPWYVTGWLQVPQLSPLYPQYEIVVTAPPPPFIPLSQVCRTQRCKVVAVSQITQFCFVAFMHVMSGHVHEKCSPQQDTLRYALEQQVKLTRCSWRWLTGLAWLCCWNTLA